MSTGAHVLLGKILQNHMLDLRIRNSKLFWRALAMLQVGHDGLGLCGAVLGLVSCLDCHRDKGTRGAKG